MKHVVRIIIAVLIVGIIGFGIWYFAFRKEPHEAVFDGLTDVLSSVENVEMKYEYKKNVDDTDMTVVEVKGYNEIVDAVVDSLTLVKAATALANISIEEFNVVYNSIKNIDGKDEYSFEGVNYYYTLTASARKVKNRDKKQVLRLAEDYAEAVQIVANTAGDISLGVKNINYTNTTEVDELINKEKTLLRNIITKQQLQCELFVKLRNYTEDYVFGGYVDDNKSAIYNIYHQELSTALNAANYETFGQIELLDENSLINKLSTRKIELENKNYYMDDGTDLNFANSYKKLYLADENNIANILKIKKYDSENNVIEASSRLTFVTEYEGKIVDGVVSDANLSLLAADYKISKDLVVDIYNVLKYIA